MPELTFNLKLSRCPHCTIANPNLCRIHSTKTNNHNNTFKRTWGFYACSSCGGVVSAWGNDLDYPVVEYFPASKTIQDDIPEKPRIYLQQALESLHAPAGAVMLAASAVDAMLKIKGFKQGSLYTRIEKAVTDHVITDDMAKWAHEVRLDANDQRHADEEATLPSNEDAKRVTDFAIALADILFVLPSRIQRGINNVSN